MTALEAQAHLMNLWQNCRTKLDELFYYAEQEDLKKRLPAKGSWSVSEVFFHLNLLNAAYLENMPKAEQLKDAEGSRVLKRSFLGKQLERSMALKPDGGMRMKTKTPAATDPIAAQKRGHALVENVVFQELLSDLDSIKKYIELLDQKALEKEKVATLFPILKINAADALFVLLEHELRHIAQAKRILEA